MVEDSIEDIRRNAVAEIKEKAKKNPMSIHPCSKEFQEDMKRLKFVSGYEFTCWMQQNEILVNPANIKRKELEMAIKNAQCKTIKEYQDKCAQKLGFKNVAEQITEYNHETGRNLSMELNKYCSSNFGIAKGERLLFKRFLEDVIFEDVKGSGKGSCDGGIDLICKNARQDFIDKYPQFKLKRNKEYKIQLEMRCLIYRYDTSTYWNFTHIDYNDTPDFFILCGCDNRFDTNPMHIWIFHKNDIVRGYKFWRRNGLHITNKPEKLQEFCRHELYDELEILKRIVTEISCEKEKDTMENS